MNQVVDLSGTRIKPCNQVTSTIKTGTCGFGVAQAEYARSFHVLKFSILLRAARLTTLNRWRTQMPPDFEFALKACIGETVTPGKYYFRLHGRSGWRYQYELGELKELATEVGKSEGGYVFFNNSKMTEDALRFCKLLDYVN